MAKKVKFPLDMADGAQVRNLDELREHFDLETVLGYYKSGGLLTWLQDRYFDDEATAVEALDETAPDFQQKLCEVFGVEYTGSAVDLEEITRRQERLVKLRTFTDEAEFIEHIDQVAFDQEELADLLDEEETTIYLCGDKFTVPASRKGVKYIGVNSPSVHISGKLPESSEELGIEFAGCEVDNLPKSDSPDVKPDIKETDTRGFCTDKVTGEFIDELTKDPYFQAMVETDRYFVYMRERYPETDKGEDGGGLTSQILFDKCTGEKRRFPKGFSRFGTYLDQTNGVDGDKLFYFEKEESAKSSSQGAIWVVDLSAPAFPQKLFPLNWDRENLSACNGHVAFNDSDIGPAVYDVETKRITKISIGKGICSALYAAEKGVYFSINDYPTYTMNFYDYASKKVAVLWKAKSSIDTIYRVENGTYFYLQLREQCVRIDSSAIKEGEDAIPSVVYDTMGDSSYYTYGYRDCLVFLAKGGIIKLVDYKTGETTEIAEDAYEHHYDSGGLFRKASSRNTPVSLKRIGNWIIYDQKGDYEKTCRVSLDHPGEIEYTAKFDYAANGVEEENAFSKATYDIPEIELP